MSADTFHEVLRTQRIEVVDERGRVRVVIGDDAPGPDGGEGDISGSCSPHRTATLRGSPVVPNTPTSSSRTRATPE